MAKKRVFGFDEASYRRVVEATRRTLSTPRVGAQRRRQVPVLSGGGGGGSGDGDGAASWTIAEYDPTTGAILQTLDRGRNRTTTAVGDAYMMFSADGYLYAAGLGRISAGIASSPIVKWNIDTGEKVWESSSTGFNVSDIPFTTTTLSSDRLLVEASDGAIWYISGNAAGNTYVCRFNPTTGVQTHVSSSTVNASALFVADNAGGVGTVWVATSGVTIRVFDNTVTQTASYTGGMTAFREHNGLLYVCQNFTDTLFILNADDLTSVDSRSGPVGENYEQLCTDGTNVFVVADAVPDRIHSYDATNLATVNWSADRDSQTVQAMAIDNGELFVTGVGGTRQFDPADGSEIWENTAGGNLTRPGLFAVGSDYIAIETANGTIVCMERSTGVTRWVDHWATTPTGSSGGGGGCIVGPDDRLFICGTRLSH